MTITVQRTTTITADGIIISIENASQQVRDMVSLMDVWRQREMDTHIDLTMVQGAIRDIQNQLLIAVRNEQQNIQTAEASNNG